MTLADTVPLEDRTGRQAEAPVNFIARQHPFRDRDPGSADADIAPMIRHMASSA
jgi:hypothetical protein